MNPIFPSTPFSVPKEECCIRVDAVIGGDFDIPEGVEPVSAIYVISITTTLRQPSLLKIQHCVDLDRAHPDSGLSFTEPLLKNPLHRIVSSVYRVEGLTSSTSTVYWNYQFSVPSSLVRIRAGHTLTIVWKGMNHPLVDWGQL